jgi:hypothetical protein
VAAQLVRFARCCLCRINVAPPHPGIHWGDRNDPIVQEQRRTVERSQASLAAYHDQAPKMRKKESTAKIGEIPATAPHASNSGAGSQSRHQIKQPLIEKPGHLAGLIESINGTNAETTKLK